MQGTGVPSLVGEDPTCQGATMPVGHKTEPTCLKPLKNKKTDWNKRASPQQDKPLKWEALSPQQNVLCSRQLEKAHVQQGRPSAAKDKYHFLKICIYYWYKTLKSMLLFYLDLMCIIICEKDRQSRLDAWDRVLGASALGWPWGMGWGGRWEGGSRWGTHVHLWQIHVNVWQKPPQYCKVTSLQLK